MNIALEKDDVLSVALPLGALTCPVCFSLQALAVLPKIHISQQPVNLGVLECRDETYVKSIVERNQSDCGTNGGDPSPGNAHERPVLLVHERPS